MRTLLFSMLLACGDSGDSGDNGNEDPQWFEAGTYSCVSDSCPYNPTVTFTQTGSISPFVFSFDNDGGGRTERNAECFVGEAITPDETMWEVSCNGDSSLSRHMKDIVVYSEGFRLDLTWGDSDYRFE